MIQLTAELQYDETLSFEEQSEEVQAFVNSKIATPPTTTLNNETCGRKELEQWNGETYVIERSYSYSEPANSRLFNKLTGTTLTVKSV